MNEDKKDETILENESLISQGLATKRNSDDPDMADILADIDTSEIDEIISDDDISEDEMMREFDDLIDTKGSEESAKSSEISDPLVEPEYNFSEIDDLDTLDELGSSVPKDEADIEVLTDIVDTPTDINDAFNNDPTIVDKIKDSISQNKTNSALALFAAVFLVALFWPQGGSERGQVGYENDDYVADWDDELPQMEINHSDSMTLNTQPAAVDNSTPPIVERLSINNEYENKEAELITENLATRPKLARENNQQTEESLVLNKRNETASKNFNSETSPESIAVTEYSVERMEVSVAESNIELTDYNEIIEPGKMTLAEIPNLSKLSQTLQHQMPTNEEEYETEVADPNMVVKNKEAVYLILDKMKERDEMAASKIKEDKEFQRKVSSILTDIKSSISELRKDADKNSRDIDSVRTKLNKIKASKLKESITRKAPLKKKSFGKKIAYKVVSSKKDMAYIVSNRTGKLVRLDTGDRLLGYGKILSIFPGSIINTENGLVKTKPKV